MPVPWTNEEELQLLKEVSEQKTFDNIAIIHNRSESAIELRLKKLIYDNIISGKKKSSMAKLLHVEPDKIKQYYYEYKGFIEKKGLKMDNANLSEIERSMDKTNSTKKHKEKEKNKDKHGGAHNKDNKVKERLLKLEKENKIMKEILDNIGMKKKIDKLIDNGFLNEKIKSVIKRVK
jgi:predicted transcriptional regulator